MRDYTLELTGEPVAKARPRATRTGHIYTPAKTKEQETRIREAWVAKYGEDFEPLTGTITIDIVFGMKRPKRINPETPERPNKRPDIDNLVKTVLDALNGVAYVDDKQIVSIVARKIWSKGDTGFTDIYIHEILRIEK